MSFWLLPAVVAAAIGRAWHGAAARRVTEGYTRRFPAGDEGIALGAEGFMLAGTNGRALLLLHGSGDTPQTFRYLGQQLHRAGYSVYAPLLPGHGRSPASFARVDAAAYLEAAHAGLDELRKSASWIGVVGFSMGGALGAQLAAGATDVRALALLAPYFMPPAFVRYVALTSWAWGSVVPFVAGRGESSVHDAVAGAESRAYGVFSPAALRALVATAAAGLRALPHVSVPTLVVHSREDNRIPAALAERVVATLRAPTEHHWVTGCGHVITVDYCKDTVATLVIDFFTRQPR